MIFFKAFLVAGTFCFLAQVLMDNTKLTPGHITSLFVIIGAVLSFFGLYSKLIEFGGAGATVLISNFGHMLYTSAIEGYHEVGILGLASGLLVKSSLAIVSAVVFAFIFALLFKPKS